MLYYLLIAILSTLERQFRQVSKQARLPLPNRTPFKKKKALFIHFIGSYNHTKQKIPELCKHSFNILETSKMNVNINCYGLKCPWPELSEFPVKPSIYSALLMTSILDTVRPLDDANSSLQKVMLSVFKVPLGFLLPFTALLIGPFAMMSKNSMKLLLLKALCKMLQNNFP